MATTAMSKIACAAAVCVACAASATGRTANAPPRAEIAPPRVYSLTDTLPLMKRADGEYFLLRIGRRAAPANHIVRPTCLAFENPPEDADGTRTVKWRLRWAIDSDAEATIEGDVTLANTPDDKMRVTYDLRPSEKCARDGKFLEFGLTISYAGYNRVDWVGDGIFASASCESAQNEFGTWSLHADDFRLPGNRSHVKWAAIGRNGWRRCIILESSTGNVSFDKIGDEMMLTENIAVAERCGDPSGEAEFSCAEAGALYESGAMKGTFLMWAGNWPKPLDAATPVRDEPQHCES